MQEKSESNYRAKLSEERTRYRWVSDHGDRMFHRERKEPTSLRKNSTEKPANTLAKKSTRWPF
jgi:hypothetical protein